MTDQELDELKVALRGNVHIIQEMGWTRNPDAPWDYAQEADPDYPIRQDAGARVIMALRPRYRTADRRPASTERACTPRWGTVSPGLMIFGYVGRVQLLVDGDCAGCPGAVRAGVWGLVGGSGRLNMV